MAGTVENGWDAQYVLETLQRRYSSIPQHQRAFQPFQGIPGSQFQNLHIAAPLTCNSAPVLNTVGKRKGPISDSLSLEDDDMQIIASTLLKKRAPRKKVEPKEPKKEGSEEGASNWKDCDVEVLISLRGEMDPEFLKNAKKQGVDVWVKLHARLLALIPGLNRSAEACKKKFNNVFKQCKVDKMANTISGEGRHECKFYDSIDQWWHQTGTVMKHVSASANDTDHISLENSQLPEDSAVSGEHATVQEPSSSFRTSPVTFKSGKKLYHEQTYHMFTQMVENSSVMVKHFQKTNDLLEKVERQMDRIIDKL